MRRKTARLHSWVTPAERDEVQALAKQAHLTTSELVRRLVTGRRLPDSQRHEDVLALIDVNADLASLGNLLRMALDDPNFTPPGDINLEDLFQNMRDTQVTLKRKIERL